MLKNGGELYFEEKNTKSESTGDTLIAIVRNNKIVSVMYTYKHSLTPESKRVDYVLNDVYELDDFVE